ncbi:hypothetical protein LSAT2_010700, partial [Lamellibrachia satsuma]
MDLPSPAQRLRNRRTRTLLPMTNRLLEPALDTDLKSKMMYAKSKQAAYYNRNARDLWTQRQVHTRQVDTKSASYRRNRAHLRKTNEADPLSDHTHSPVTATPVKQPASTAVYTSTPICQSKTSALSEHTAASTSVCTTPGKTAT